MEERSIQGFPRGLDLRLTAVTGSHPKPEERVLQNARFTPTLVIGWCPLRAAVRSFRLDRVTSVRAVASMDHSGSPSSSEGGWTW